MLEADDVPDAASAIANAWKTVEPNFKDTLASSAPRAAFAGWNDFVVYTYDTPASESRAVYAVAMRFDRTWTVVTVQASLAVLERHSAEFGALMNSMTPAGYVHESFVGRVPNRLDEAKIAELRKFVDESMRKLRIPGAAIAVIDGSRIVYEQGLGIRKLGNPTPVDTQTRFMIASNTKGMTTLLMARLVDEGKMRWDQPVTELYPEVKLADADATRKLQVRHLICACTGLPRADLETFFIDPMAPAQLAFDQLAQLKPTTEFGKTYQYSNTLAAVAGFVAGHVAYPALDPGLAYDRAMRELVWKPLGMTETSFDDPRFVRGNVASPYGDTLEGGIGDAPQGLNATLLPVRPTGSAWTSVHDMALYVRNEVTEGRLPDGTQWLGRDALLARRVRGVSTGEDAWYGMGLQTKLVGGIETVFHGGAVNGYMSNWIVVPNAKIGAVILTSGNNGYPLVTAFRRKVMELLYDGKPEAESGVDAAVKQIDSGVETARKTISRSVPHSDVLGIRYANPLLGTITVRRKSDHVTFDFGPWSSEMGIKRDSNVVGGFDYVSITASTIGDLAFEPGRDGKLRTLTLRDSQHVYLYREVPPN